jgi:hypothetical protein
MTVEDTTKTSIRAALCGLTTEEELLLAQTLRRSFAAALVDDLSYNVLVVDVANPETSRLLRERVVGAVIILACNPEEPEVPGVVMLRRPLTPDAIVSVFTDVQTLVSRRAAALGRDFSVSARLRGMSLKELAANYRFGATRGKPVSIAIEGQRFCVDPQRNLYWSKSSPEDLSHFRTKPVIDVEIVEASSKEIDSAVSPHRLDEFLWHLGSNAGAGRLLPWLTEQRAYRITRWPPVVRKDNNSVPVTLGTLMARRTLRPSELSRATGIGHDIVADFLNGCSLTGCLESFNLSDAPTPKFAMPKSFRLAPILARIRSRLGIA